MEYTHREIKKTHTHTHTLIHTCMHACMPACVHACVHACIHAHMHTCTHAYMHTCMHIYIHLHMHTCAGTRAHVQAERQDSGAPETTSLSSDVEGGKRGDAGRGSRPGQGLGLGDAGCSTAHCLALAVLPSVFAFVQVSTTQSRRKMAKVRRPLFWLKGGTYLHDCISARRQDTVVKLQSAMLEALNQPAGMQGVVPDPGLHLLGAS